MPIKPSSNPMPMTHRNTALDFILGLLLTVAPIGFAAPLPAINLEGLEPSVRSQFEAALGTFEEQIQSAAGNPEASATQYAELGRLYHAYEFLPAAQWCYEQALYANPIDFASLYLAAVASETLGQHQLAIARYQAALLLRPDYLPAALRLSTQLRESGELTAARLVLERAPGSAREAPAWLAAAGEQSLAEERYEDAIQLLSQALILQPGANRLYYPIATAYRQLGEADLARQSLARSGAIGVAPEDSILARVRSLSAGELANLIDGRRAFAAGDFAAAVELFGQALEANPDSVAGRVNLGSALIQLGYHDNARQQFLAALRIDPQNVAALHNLGALGELESNLPDALDWYTRVLAIHPQEPEVNYRVGLLRKKTGDHAAAIAHLSKAQRDNRFFADASFELAGIATNTEQYQLAINILEDARRKAPQHRKLSLALAKLLAASPQLDLRDGPSALNLAQEAHRRLENAASAEVLALALAESGRCAEARQTAAEAQEAATQGSTIQKRLGAAMEKYDRAAPCRP